jgi:hypothetical protein
VAVGALEWRLYCQCGPSMNWVSLVQGWSPSGVLAVLGAAALVMAASAYGAIILVALTLSALTNTHPPAAVIPPALGRWLCVGPALASAAAISRPQPEVAGQPAPEIIRVLDVATSAGPGPSLIEVRPSEPARSPGPGRPIGSWVVVAPGDSFWSLAKSWASEPGLSTAAISRYWLEVMAANADRLTVPGDYNLIFPGQRLWMPPYGQSR